LLGSQGPANPARRIDPASPLGREIVDRLAKAGAIDGKKLGLRHIPSYALKRKYSEAFGQFVCISESNGHRADTASFDLRPDDPHDQLEGTLVLRSRAIGEARIAQARSYGQNAPMLYILHEGHFA
jgi:hypothetical protein